MPIILSMDASESAVNRRVEEIATVVQNIVESCGLKGILAVFLYGSALDRLFRPDSDLDVAVLDDKQHPLGWPDQARLMDALERTTGRGVDLRMLRESSLSHQAHVIERGRLVWIGVIDAVEQYMLETLMAAVQARKRSEPQWSQTLNRLAKTAATR
jgi:predicted nucleotidyltransferase